VLSAVHSAHVGQEIEVHYRWHPYFGCTGFGGAGALAPSPNVVPSQAREQVSNELIETAKGLEVTQQQAVDQLQIVQDQLAAQKAETKKLSEQISAVTEKLDALQGSIANIPAPSVASPVSRPKSRRQ
jgi:septal ring factor EnvC (AmiA/AmiB activator)